MNRRSLLLWGTVSLLLLPVTFLLAPPGSPPLYDGLGFPEDPYRYVGTADGPEAASLGLDVPAAGSPQAYLQTPERGPQAALVLLADAVTADAGSTRVTVRIEPVRPPGRVRDGELLGNAYRVDLVGGALRGLDAAVVQLRVPEETDDPVTLEHHDGEDWRTLETRRIGLHVHSAFLPAEGTVAAVRVRDARLSVPYGAEVADDDRALWVVGGALGLLLAVVVVLRARRPARVAPSARMRL